MPKFGFHKTIFHQVLSSDKMPLFRSWLASFIFGMSESQLPGYFLAHDGHGEAWTLELEGPRLNLDSTTQQLYDKDI